MRKFARSERSRALDCLKDEDPGVCVFLVFLVFLRENARVLCLLVMVVDENEGGREMRELCESVRVVGVI